ncbi:MAG: hydrolase 1, exosortase A system-associated [Halioglobus sp.]
MTAYREEGVVFACGDNRLVGVAAIPETTSGVGVLILVGGPQYRVGSHRQFTLLARRLAESGFASMRFDYTGMGDSEGDPRGFEEIEDDLAAAISVFLETVPGVKRVVLWGLCDAASSAMMFAHRHSRVTGMILLNPWVHSGDYSPQVKLAHYYRPSFARKDQWHRLLSGKIKLIPAFRELGRDALALLGIQLPGSSRKSSSGSFVTAMLDGLLHFRHGVLIVLGEADLTAREFSTMISHDALWKAAISGPAIRIRTVKSADHTFSKKPWKEEVSQLTIDWLQDQ